MTEHTPKKRPVCPSSLTPLLDRRSSDGEGGILNSVSSCDRRPPPAEDTRFEWRWFTWHARFAQNVSSVLRATATHFTADRSWSHLYEKTATAQNEVSASGRPFRPTSAFGLAGVRCGPRLDGHAVRTPCPSCGSHGVWTRLAAVKNERKKIVMDWLCTSCNHAWTTETARPEPPRAKLPPRRRRRA